MRAGVDRTRVVVVSVRLTADYPSRHELRIIGGVTYRLLPMLRDPLIHRIPYDSLLLLNTLSWGFSSVRFQAHKTYNGIIALSVSPLVRKEAYI
jgi:hypothetical protein